MNRTVLMHCPVFECVEKCNKCVVFCFIYDIHRERIQYNINRNENKIAISSKCFTGKGRCGKSEESKSCDDRCGFDQRNLSEKYYSHVPGD